MQKFPFNILCLGCLFGALIAYGCGFSSSSGRSRFNQQNLPTSTESAENRLAVYFFRHANFNGAGRTHILKVDGKVIGQLLADNYYFLEMWPGKYHFSISLPKEEFFGTVSLPITVSRQIKITPHPTGDTYACEYTDGMGTKGFSVKNLTAEPQNIEGRTLTRRLSAHDTAQVTSFFDARYDGPAVYGRPHGYGTLVWPDGGIYKGIFEHGVPTGKARFFYPDGRIFMGPNYRGRPKSPGILMDPEGKILFAGKFKEEQPDGVGIRQGAEDPQFCEFLDGRDTTKSFRLLAKEALDVEDRQAIDSQPDPAEHLTAEIESQRRRLEHLAARHDPDTVRTAFAESQKQIEALEIAQTQMGEKKALDQQNFVTRLRASRYERENAKANEFYQLHRAKIAKERQWCLDEQLRGNNLCACAPLVDDFHTWQECQEPLRKRYID